MSSQTEIEFSIQYDSQSPVLDAGKVQIALPIGKTTTFKIYLSGVVLVFADGYVPSTLIGYIAVSGTEAIQAGMTCLMNGIPTRGKLIFPVVNPASIYVKPSVSNRIILEPDDTFKLTFLDETMTEVTLARLIATVHLRSVA